MTTTWPPHQWKQIAEARELDIAVQRSDGTLGPWTPIWVVQAAEQVYVRSWYRRDTGWFGSALRSHRARIRVAGLETGVAVEDIGQGSAGLRESVDGAYRNKYGGAGSSSMVTDTAAATTQRLDPETPPQHRGARVVPGS